MPARRKAPRVRLTISCLDSEWERIREIAERRGVSINDHAVSAGLSVELGPPRDAPALALSEAEQRRLLDRVDRLADSMLGARIAVSARASGSSESQSRAASAPSSSCGCCSASNVDPTQSLEINGLPRRSASSLRADQQGPA